MFLPKCAGAYVAHMQVFSHSFVKKDDICRDVIPVNVTLQAIAEDPWITVCNHVTVMSFPIVLQNKLNKLNVNHFS